VALFDVQVPAISKHLKNIFEEEGNWTKKWLFPKWKNPLNMGLLQI
jgi:hypothetical protein